ncbi:MAG: citrate/2-methylcitrate synthase, partial [Pseudomonadota bacterium]
MSEVADWWRTSIIDMEPGRIHLRGTPVQDLIGTTGFAEMIWLMVVGERIEGPRAQLFEAALVAAVDHGPQAPSIAAARMAATCGVGLNNAMATGVNMLGDVHGGAGEQAVELFLRLDTAGQAAFDRELDGLVKAVAKAGDVSATLLAPIVEFPIKGRLPRG